MSSAPVRPSHSTRRGPALWALLGVTAMFVEAVWRLGLRALNTLNAGLSVAEWTALGTMLAIFGYYEGFRALHQRFMPALVYRAFSIGPGGPAALLAPFTALALVNVPKASLRHGWLAVALIVAAVFVVRQFPEPWRGIIDGAVAFALSIGLVSLLGRFAARWRQ